MDKPIIVILKDGEVVDVRNVPHDNRVEVLNFDIETNNRQ